VLADLIESLDPVQSSTEVIEENS